MVALLDVSKFRSVRARGDERVHTFEATKGVEDIFKFMLVSSESGRMRWENRIQMDVSPMTFHMGNRYYPLLQL